ncbi:MAG: hypothetical protein K9I34_05890, partial [Bacteroidales bacterium]|nr:hypothetical protein [Bacteroidales bacterium]
MKVDTNNQADMTKKDVFLAPENEVRFVEAPDGSVIEVNPLEDYFCQERPKELPPRKGAIEKFMNWARAESLWVLGFGTGC